MYMKFVIVKSNISNLFQYSYIQLSDAYIALVSWMSLKSFIYQYIAQGNGQAYLAIITIINIDC